ncbi:hypothetical protein [Sphingobium sp. JS3065]|uniref:hypothetical protein n=1 Tax=Sphingobium sp. JS3065 TaxID=2970925 RepID=UPI003A5C072D
MDCVKAVRIIPASPAKKSNPESHRSGGALVVQLAATERNITGQSAPPDISTDWQKDHIFQGLLFSSGVL